MELKWIEIEVGRDIFGRFVLVCEKRHFGNRHFGIQISEKKWMMNHELKWSENKWITNQKY